MMCESNIVVNPMLYRIQGFPRIIFDLIQEWLFLHSLESVEINRMVQIIIKQEGFDCEEVKDAIALLYYPGGLLFEPELGKLALVKTFQSFQF